MNRAFNDNALLRDINRLQDVDTIYKTVRNVAGTAIAIGLGWFLCVAVPAKALWQ